MTSLERRRVRLSAGGISPSSPQDLQPSKHNENHSPPSTVPIPTRVLAQRSVAGVALVERRGRRTGRRGCRWTGSRTGRVALAVAAAAVGSVSVQSREGVHRLLTAVAASGPRAAPCAAAAKPTRPTPVAVGHVRLLGRAEG